MSAKTKPKLAVWKFASCDGCQLSLLDCEDELLAIAGAVEIANFPEATRALTKGPYDLSLVEGSITTPGASVSSSFSANGCSPRSGSWSISHNRLPPRSTYASSLATSP